MNCSQQQLNWNQTMPGPGWDPQQLRHLNGSNMSLNLPAQAYYPQQQQQQQQMPPPAWVNSWGAPTNMYPYPVNMMPPMNQGNCNDIFL